MRPAFVHNLDDLRWHRAEWRDGQPRPLRKALCGERAQTLSEAESTDSWTVVWNRAIDPPGEYCAACDELAVKLFGAPAPYVLGEPLHSSVNVDSLLRGVFGADGPPL